MKRRTAHPRLRVGIAGALTALITFAGSTVARGEAPAPQANAPATVSKAPATARKPLASVKPAARASHRRTHATRSLARASRPAATPVGSAGMKAAIDPATGRLVRPTAEQVQALEAQSGVARLAPDDDPSRGIPIVKLANGAELAKLDERFQEYEVARIGPDGKLIRECVHGPEGVAQFRKAAQAQAAAPSTAPAQETPSPKREVK